MELPESLMRKKKTAALVQLNTIHKQNVSYIQLQYQPKTKKSVSCLPYYKHLINKAYTVQSCTCSHQFVWKNVTLVMCTDLPVFFLFSHNRCQDSSIMQTSCLVNKSCHDFALVCNCCSHMQKNSERTTCMLPGLYSRQFSTDLTVL